MSDLWVGEPFLLEDIGDWKSRNRFVTVPEVEGREEVRGLSSGSEGPEGPEVNCLRDWTGVLPRRRGWG